MIAIPSDYYGMLAGIESGNNPNAYNKASGASGLYQFLKSTWTGLGYSLGDIFNPAEQQAAVQTFTQQNAAALNNAGIPINDASLYAAHFLGAGTAVNILEAPTSASASDYVSSAAVRENPGILSGTVGDFFNWLNRKTGTSVNSSAAGSNNLPNDLTGFGTPGFAITQLGQLWDWVSGSKSGTNATAPVVKTINGNGLNIGADIQQGLTGAFSSILPQLVTPAKDVAIFAVAVIILGAGLYMLATR